MKVLQLVSSTGYYGAERMINLLASSLRKIGIETSLGIFNANQPACARFFNEAIAQEIPVWNLSCRGKWDLNTVQKLVRFLRANRIDVLHTHGYKANIYGYLAARAAGCSIVSTCHNWTNRTSSLKRYAQLDRFLLRKFDAVVAVSQTLVSDLRHAGVRARRISLISNGINVKSYQQFAMSQSVSGSPVLGCLSRLSSEKGVDVLLWALPKVLNRYPDLHCFIAGEGPERSRLEGLAEELGISHAVHLPGFCDDTPTFLRYCTVVVQPSRIEAMPLAVLEAMAAGKAIVASAVGEIPRLLEDGNAGALVPPAQPELLADMILHLLSNPQIRKKMEKRAAEKAIEQFDVSIMTREYVEAYQKVTARRTKGHREFRPKRVGAEV